MPASRRIAALLLAATVTLAGCTSPEETEEDTDQPTAPEIPPWNTAPASIAATGDSITTAFDACSVLSDCLEASWATGTDTRVPSLAQLLLPDDGSTDLADRTWNVAEAGAKMSDLPAQMEAAVAYEPELITVLIGANDACAVDELSMTEVADFREDFTASLHTVRETLPTTGVYVASVPDLHQLWSEGSPFQMARQVWRLADICPSMLADPMAVTIEAEERRETVRSRVREFNDVLEEVCAADEQCRYDGGAVFEYPFTTADLSGWDWFHPSRVGQAALAELAYEQVSME